MLWDRYDALILDLDGVVYIGDAAVPHAIESLLAIAGSVRLSAATNNAAREASVVGAHLRRLGLPVSDDEVVTSAQAGAALLAAEIPAGSEVLAIGGSGVSSALSEVGLLPLRADSDLERSAATAARVRAVMQGHGFDSTWSDFAAGAFAINAGALWVATNRDATVPLPMGFGPGNGAFVEALRFATGKEPIVAGKPQPALFLETKQRLGLANPLVVGDRIDTDIDGARAAGLDSLLVLTGVTSAESLQALAEDRRPTYVAADLRCLLEPQPPSGLG